jgi:RNA polymerase sigma factor (sigma-70 family)
LIKASRNGDAAAYDSLYRRHVAAAHGLARQLVRNRAEADDVVAETFAKILGLLHRGGGPDDAFRPYLLTAVRRAAYDRHRAERRQLVTDEMEAFDRGVPFADPAVADLERTMIARAFASLPERWQAVLWHTEIEGARPADVAPLLGLTANSVAALAYRAREGLRQAYLRLPPGGRRRPGPGLVDVLRLRPGSLPPARFRPVRSRPPRFRSVRSRPPRPRRPKFCSRCLVFCS